MTQHKRGFTLIELLVVIAIIGILSSVVLASLNTARQKSRDAKRISDVRQVQLALELYFDDNNGYPTSTDGLDVLATDGYIAVVPTDPIGDSVDYLYTPSSCSGGTCSDYLIGANLEGEDHSALDSDVDGSATGIDGADDDGCGNESSRYCYDVSP